MRTRAAIALAVAALVTGCGADESPFGDVSEADRTRYADVNQHIERFSIENSDWIEAADDAKVERARRELDGAQDAVADARAEVAQIENGELRARIGDYVATLENYVGAANRLMSAAERTVRPDRKTQDRLVTAVNAAARRVARAEEEFARFLADSVPEEHMDEFRTRSE